MTLSRSYARHSCFINARDGLRLHYLDYPGDRAKTPIVCLPGLARSAEDFDPLARRLAARGRRVLALDYRGRGASQWDEDWRNYNLEAEQADILAVLSAAGVERAFFFGTSRGGLHIFLLAETKPGLFTGVALNDIGPKIETEGLMRIKRYVGKLPPLASIDDAAGLMRLSAGAYFSGVSAEEWAAYARQTFEEKDGKVVLRYDPALAHTLDTAGQDLEEYDFWAGFEALAGLPLLAIRGAASDILSVATLGEMARRHPGMERVIVEGQGHAPLLLDAATLEKLVDFIERAA